MKENIQRPIGNATSIGCNGCFPRLAGLAIINSFLRHLLTVDLSETDCTNHITVESNHAWRFQSATFSVAWKPILLWVPSQNGLLLDCPHRQSAMLSLSSGYLSPAVSSSSTTPCTL